MIKPLCDARRSQSYLLGYIRTVRKALDQIAIEGVYIHTGTV
jgi:hypothetical protein